MFFIYGTLFKSFDSVPEMFPSSGGFAVPRRERSHHWCETITVRDCLTLT